MSDASPDTSPTLPVASETFAWEVLGPCVAGWIIEIFLTGICVQKSLHFLSSSSMLSKKMKMVLCATLFLNGIVFFTTIAEAFLWTTTQSRDEETLWSFKLPDAWQPIIAGLTAFVVQGFFAERAWKICNHSRLFLVYISIGVLAALTGALGLGIVQLLNTNGYTAYNYFLIFTELWLWAAALVDLSISVIIIVGLTRKKTGYDLPTDSIAKKVICATMESASMTTTFALAAAITDICTWKYNTGAIDLAFVYALPSIYTFSLLWCLDNTDHVRRVHQSLSQPRSSQREANTIGTYETSCLSPFRGSSMGSPGMFGLGFANELKGPTDFLVDIESGKDMEFVSAESRTDGESMHKSSGATLVPRTTATSPRGAATRGLSLQDLTSSRETATRGMSFQDFLMRNEADV